MSKKKIIWICIAVIFVILIISWINNGSSTPITLSPVVSNNTANGDNTISNANTAPQQVFEEKNIDGDEAKFIVSNFDNLPSSGLVVATGTITNKIEITDAGSGSKSYFVKITTDNKNEMLGIVSTPQLQDANFNTINVGNQFTIWSTNLLPNNFDCTSNTDSQKICTALSFKASSIPMIAILDMEDVQTADASVSNTQNSQSNQITVGTPKPAPAAKPSIGISYATASAGLDKYFVIQPFSSYGNTGYQGKSPVAADITFIFSDDGINLYNAALIISDPSVGYDSTLTSFPSDWAQERVVDNQIIDLFMTNIFPNWASAEAWVGNSLQDCVRGGNTVTTNIGSIQASLSCAKTLGIYTIDIGKTK